MAEQANKRPANDVAKQHSEPAERASKAPRVRQLLKAALQSTDSQENLASSGRHVPAGHSDQVAQPQATTAASLHEVDELDELAALPSDLHAAILFLRGQVLAMPDCAGLPPVVLRTQLASVLHDHRDMEIELDEMRRSNTIRLIKLATGSDEHGIILSEDFTRLLHETAVREDQAAAASAAGEEADRQEGAGLAGAGAAAAVGGLAGSQGVRQRVVGVFCSSVIPHHTDVSIGHGRLVDLMRRAQCQVPGRQQQQQQPGTSTGAAALLPSIDDQVSLLMNMGVLARHLADDQAYALCVPGLGLVVSALMAGRKELHGMVARKKYGEVPERQLLKKARLRTSRLGVQYHLYDLLGRGTLSRITTTSGVIIKAVAGVLGSKKR